MRTFNDIESERFVREIEKLKSHLNTVIRVSGETGVYISLIILLRACYIEILIGYLIDVLFKKGCAHREACAEVKKILLKTKNEQIFT